MTLPFNVSPHILRRTFATQSLYNGANLLNVMKMLGHSNIKTTQKYLVSDNEKVKEESLKFNPLSKLLKSSLE